MTLEICADCGKSFEAGPNAHLCIRCRKIRLSQYAKNRNLNKIGNDAYSEQCRQRRDWSDEHGAD